MCENKAFLKCNYDIWSHWKLEFNQNKKFDKAPFIVSADLECIIEKTDGCKNNPEDSSTTKVSKCIPSGFSLSTMPWFRSRTIKNCLEEFCASLRKHIMKIINFKKKKRNY